LCHIHTKPHTHGGISVLFFALTVVEFIYQLNSPIMDALALEMQHSVAFIATFNMLIIILFTRN